jgi:hypothetical protein
MNERSTFGVALTKCYFCGEGDQIVLNRVLTAHNAAKVEKMNGRVVNMNPCNKCQGYMQQGIILITIDEAKSGADWNKPPPKSHCLYAGRKCFGDHKCQCNCEGCHCLWMPNPYRTGGFYVVKEDALARILDATMFKFARQHRWMFIADDAAEKIGLGAKD